MVQMPPRGSSRGQASSAIASIHSVLQRRIRKEAGKECAMRSHGSAADPAKLKQSRVPWNPLQIVGSQQQGAKLLMHLLW